MIKELNNMKSLRKYTAAALSALLIASAMPFAASAAQADADSGTGEVIRGDVNGDGAVKIDDATTIQRYLAKYVTLTDAQLKAADINGDGQVSISDSTEIQKFLAGYGNPYKIGETIETE